MEAGHRAVLGDNLLLDKPLRTTLTSANTIGNRPVIGGRIQYSCFLSDTIPVIVR